MAPNSELVQHIKTYGKQNASCFFQQFWYADIPNQNKLESAAPTKRTFNTPTSSMK